MRRAPVVHFPEDAQDVPPLFVCDRCHGEIYRYDPVGDVAGLLLHESCMTDRERARWAVASAFRYQEEWD